MSEGNDAPHFTPGFEAACALMPTVVRELLVENKDPDSVSVDALLSALGRDSGTGLSMAYEAPVMEVPGLLSTKACSILRAVVDAQRTLARDSVDGEPEHQLNLSVKALELLIGPAECSKIWRIPKRFRLETAVVLVPEQGSAPSSLNESAEGAEAGAQDASDTLDAALGELREIFVRRYSVETRPWIPFHTDAYEITVNIALSDDKLHGGSLLGAFNGQVRTISRAEGDATVHSSKLLHGVSAMMDSEARYSLIVFFDRRGAAKGRWAST